MRLWLLAIIGCGLVGCSRGDPEICAPIPNVVEPSDAIPAHRNLSTARRIAEACLHREAYRQARSGKSITVGGAEALHHCSDEVSVFSGRFAAAQEPPNLISEHFNLVVRPRLMEEARSELLQFAESKVREGQAGRCRA